jgi:hypothetical protein
MLAAIFLCITCNPRNWWQEIKRFTGQSARHPLDPMARELSDGDTRVMASEINAFLLSVSGDLRPLNNDLIPDVADVCPDERIIYPFEVEQKLATVDPHKSCGTDNIRY